MKLGQAQKLAREQMNVLFRKKQELTKLLDGELPNGTIGSYDRVELTKALSVIEEEYELTRAAAQQLTARQTNLQNAEIARQQSEAAAEAAEDLMKILEVFRRIAKGDHVPPEDEKRLMEYSTELYMAAKNMALMNRSEETEKHKSLWEEEDPSEGEAVDPMELADNVEVGNPVPRCRSVELSTETE